MKHKNNSGDAVPTNIKRKSAQKNTKNDENPKKTIQITIPREKPNFAEKDEQEVLKKRKIQKNEKKEENDTETEDFLGFFPEARPAKAKNTPIIDLRVDDPRRTIGIFNAQGLSNTLKLLSSTMWNEYIDFTFVSETMYHNQKDTTAHPFVAAASRPFVPRQAAKHGCALVASDRLQNQWENRLTVLGADPDGHFVVWIDRGVQFIGLYLPPKHTESLEIINQAFAVANRHPLEHRVICGDLNIEIEFDEYGVTLARLPKHRPIINCILSYGVSPLKLPEGRYTRLSHVGNQEGTVIDHFFVSDAIRSDCDPAVDVLDAPHHLLLNSDHLMVTLTLLLVPVPDNSVKQEQWRYNTSRLRVEEIHDRYQASYMERTASMDVWFLTDLAIRFIPDDRATVDETAIEFFDDTLNTVWKDGEWHAVEMATPDPFDSEEEPDEDSDEEEEQEYMLTDAEMYECRMNDARIRMRGYATVFEATVKSNSQTYIDNLLDAVVRPITDTADNVLGRARKSSRRLPKAVMTEELRGIIRTRRILERKLQRSAVIDDDLLQQVKVAESNYKSAMQKARNLTKMYYFGGVDVLENSEMMKIMCSITSQRGRRRVTLGHTHEDLSEYAKFYEHQYRTADGTTTSNDFPDLEGTETKIRIGTAEIVKAIKRMPRGKTAGPSRFPTELLKPIATEVSFPLAILFNEIVRLGKVPTPWKQALLFPIAKVPSPKSIGDHRPISLTEHLRKCFEHCILHRVVDAVEPLHPSQCGFRRQRSTIDQIATYQEIMLQFKRVHGYSPQVVFLDIKAAYDSVDRGKLWQMMLQLGVDPFLVRTTSELFDHCTSRVVVNGRMSSPFRHIAGLMQGSVLSPVLYSIYINPLACLLDSYATLRVIDRKTGGLFYADDIAVFAKNHAAMKNILKACEDHSLQNNYRFNPKKCETFASADSYSMYGANLTHCREFKYLGMMMGPDGIDWKAHVKRMCDKALQRAQFYKMLGADGYRMGERTVLCIYKTFIRSVMEYGLQIMPCKRDLLRTLESTQRRCLALLLSVFSNVNQCSVRVFYHLQTMTHRHEELSTRWALRLARKRKPNYLVIFAAEKAQKYWRSRSCFSFVQSVNNNLLEYCRSEYLEGNRFWERMYIPIRLLFRKLRLEQDRLNSTCPNAIKINKDGRAVAAYAIGQADTVSRRIVTLYLLGKIPSVPKPCLNCTEPKCTIKHAFWCSGMRPPDNLIFRGSYRLARERIIDVMRICVEDYAYFERTLLSTETDD